MKRRGRGLGPPTCLLTYTNGMHGHVSDELRKTLKFYFLLLYFFLKNSRRKVFYERYSK
jgi:hypothetical protein